MLIMPLRFLLGPMLVGLILMGGPCLMNGPGLARAADIEELDANAEAQEDSDEGSNEDALADGEFGESQKCVNTNRISHTKIIDDRTIVFHMYGSVTYLNRLPRRCNGLRTAGAFSYDLRTPRLCDIDTIRVVDYFGGAMRAGIGCPLGEFQLISDEQLDLLRHGDDEDS